MELFDIPIIDLIKTINGGPERTAPKPNPATPLTTENTEAPIDFPIVTPIPDVTEPLSEKGTDNWQEEFEEIKLLHSFNLTDLE